MGWIERLFGSSPDGGNGSLEALVAVGLALLFAAAVFARQVLRARRRDVRSY